MEKKHTDEENVNISTTTYETKSQSDSVFKNSDNDRYCVRNNMDKLNHRYPYCIVWTPLPVISWFLPIIGHTGICSSNGKINDFAGSYYVSIDNMAFGEPYKYIYLDPSINEQDKWDDSLLKANDRFNNEEHNLFLNNCHSHVAHALNNIKYRNYSNYNMIHIWWYCMTRSRYVSYSHVVKTYIGFLILCLMIFLIIRLN